MPGAEGSAAAGAFAGAAGAEGPGFGGGLGAAGDIFSMIGDQGPYSALQAIRFPPIPPPIPPGTPNPARAPGQLVGRSVKAAVPIIRGLKIADNQSPRPVDRVFVDFNFYDNVNSAINHRLRAPVNQMNAYHELFGLEKTFWDRRASVGLRVPVNSLQVDSSYPGLGRTHSAFGNLGVFFKYILLQDRNGNLLSAGLSVNAPTGPASYAGFPITGAINTTEIQPYLGYILTSSNWYFQGFTSVAVPTDPALPTVMFIDNAVGYYLFRSNDLRRLVTAVAPTFETHVNTPLNHRGYRLSDPFGIPDVVNLTFGINFEIFGNSILTLSYVRPVTGPLPFDGEFALLFNMRFGPSRRTRVLPPIAGG
jgi:hypothetical protein